MTNPTMIRAGRDEHRRPRAEREARDHVAAVAVAAEQEARRAALVRERAPARALDRTLSLGVAPREDARLGEHGDERR